MWHFACCWHKIFSILVMKQFSYHCVDIMDIIYYLCSCDGFVHNEALKDKQKEKNMQNIKQRLKYFGIESYSENWQTADSHEKVQADKKKNIIFFFILSNLFACLNCLPVALLTVPMDIFLFHCSLFYQNVKSLL